MMTSDLMGGTALVEVLLLCASFLLCGTVGIERQLAQKSAGFRTHALVGMGSCGFTLISAFGFGNGSDPAQIVDPTRVAAQVVSGIGFLGAGIIFMRRDVVRGLTTAASVWLTAAVGMACGAEMLGLAGTLVALHLLATRAVAPLIGKLPTAAGKRVVRMQYTDGHGVLRRVLAAAAEMGYRVTIEGTDLRERKDGRVSVVAWMRFHGRPPIEALVVEISEIDGVRSVTTARKDRDSD